MRALQSHSSCDSYLTMAGASKTSQITFTFVVDVTGERLAADEFVAVFGEVKELGAWDEQRAVLLKRSCSKPKLWWVSLSMAPYHLVRYRYFVAALNAGTNVLRLRCWESYVRPRIVSVDDKATADRFGVIHPKRRIVRRAWLNSGEIVQFRVFGDALRLYDTSTAQTRLKIEPVDSKRLTSLPSVGMESAHMSSGSSRWSAQSTFGVPYTNGDLLMFQASFPDLAKIAFLVTVFVQQKPFDNSQLGFQYIYPHMMSHSAGEFVLSMASTDWRNVMAELRLEYLVISAMPRWYMSLNVVLANYWQANWHGLDIGHRGLGRSLAAPVNAAPFTENTLGAFQEAAKQHVDMVQLDVQLTKDLVPIVYHDFTIKICSSGSWTLPDDEDDLEVAYVADYTYDELMALRTFQVVNSKIVPHLPNIADVYPENHLFPTLRDVLSKVHQSLGFNVDVKWLQRLCNGMRLARPRCDMNVYVDCILNVMMRYGYGRFCFFSSCDVDVCTMLRCKQNMFPVMLRSAGICANPRLRTIKDLFSYVRAIELVGVVLDAACILQDGRYVAMARRMGLVVVAFGEHLQDKRSIARCKSSGAAAVIYDRIDKLGPNPKQNAFARDVNWQYLTNSWVPKFPVHGKC